MALYDNFCKMHQEPPPFFLLIIKNSKSQKFQCTLGFAFIDLLHYKCVPNVAQCLQLRYIQTFSVP